MKSLYKTFAQIWIIAWGGSMFDAISTIFGVMTLGNIEKNPIVYNLIATYGPRGVMLWLPVEMLTYAAMPTIVIALLRRSKIEFDNVERYALWFALGCIVCFPYLVAVTNFLFVLSQMA